MKGFRSTKPRWIERADVNPRRPDMDRREFLASAVGMCTALLVLDEVTACSSKVVGSSQNGISGGTDGGPMGAGGSAGAGGSGTGGSTAGGAGGELAPGTDGAITSGRCRPPEATFDQSCANAATAGGTEFIVDAETHWFNAADLANFPAYTQSFGPLFAIATEDNYINALFCNSDTAVACLVPWPGITCSPTRQVGCGQPLSNESILASMNKINALAGNTQRVLNHVLVMPQDPSGIDAQIAIMEESACQHAVAAWQLYPGFKPGFRLDDAFAAQVLEKGIELGVNRFCIHKGLPIGNFYDTTSNYPDDVGPTALKYPNANLIIHHAAICSGATMCGSNVEGPYDATSPMPLGTDALIRSVLDSGITPGKNVYASVGDAFSTLMNDPSQSAHFFGKLLKYLGTDNVLWGTSTLASATNAQAQIEAFRALTIPQSMQDQYGYPALTPEIKAKVFGLNAAKLYGIDPNAVRCKVSSCP